jgi:hypothetical protein
MWPENESSTAALIQAYYEEIKSQEHMPKTRKNIFNHSN